MYSDLYYCAAGWTYIFSLQDVLRISIFYGIIEKLIRVIQHLDIKRGAFEMYEYKLAKEVIKEGKSCGVDEIWPELLKR